MPFRKTASGFSCAVFLTQAGTALAEASPPLPIPRPVGADAQAQNEAPPLVPEANLDQALNPKNIDASTRGFYRALIKREAEKNGLPSDIADAVAAIESGYDPGAVGGVGEIGLMQVRPETAAMMGFKGDAAELAKPDVNIHYGVTYLGQAWRLANGDLCRALMKYRAGHGEEMMSELSVELLRPRARASCGRRLALRGRCFRAICFRACDSTRSSGETRTENPHGGSQPGLLGSAGSQGEGNHKTCRSKMAARGVAIGSLPLIKRNVLERNGLCLASRVGSAAFGGRSFPFTKT